MAVSLPVLKTEEHGVESPPMHHDEGLLLQDRHDEDFLLPLKIGAPVDRVQKAAYQSCSGPS